MKRKSKLLLISILLMLCSAMLAPKLTAQAAKVSNSDKFTALCYALMFEGKMEQDWEGKPTIQLAETYLISSGQLDSYTNKKTWKIKIKLSKYMSLMNESFAKCPSQSEVKRYYSNMGLYNKNTGVLTLYSGGFGDCEYPVYWKSSTIKNGKVLRGIWANSSKAGSGTYNYVDYYYHSSIKQKHAIERYVKITLNSAGKIKSYQLVNKSEARNALTFSVKYNANGGKNAPDKVTKSYGKSIVLSKKKPTRNGYVFKGWMTSKDANKVTYQPGDTFSGNNDITLYAKWALKPPSTPSIVYPTSKKSCNVARKLEVTCSKVSGVSGYQMRFSQNANFSGKVYTENSNKIEFNSIVPVSGNPDWYVQVRAYKTVNKETAYSAWSTTKKIHVHNSASTSIEYTYSNPKKDTHKQTKKEFLFCICGKKATRVLETTRKKHNYVMGYCRLCDTKQNGYTKIACNNKATDKGTIKLATKLNNSYFFKPLDDNNSDLIKLSAVAATTMYNKNPVSFYDNLGFDVIRAKYSAPNLSAPTRTDNDHVKYVIARKKITDSKGKKYTLFALHIKGTSADYEWISNFELGEGKMHEGFNKAAKEVEEQAKKFIKEYRAGNDIIIWLTGHSRGAAVANIIAHDFNQVYKNQKIVAYTFATPRVTQLSSTEKASKEKNIYNFINPGDFVTEVAMKDWGYERYGVDIVLKDSDMDDMKTYFRQITGVSYNGFTVKEKKNLVSSFLKLGKSQKLYDEGYVTETAIAGTTAIIIPKDYCQEGLALALTKSDTKIGIHNLLEHAYCPMADAVTAQMVFDGKITPHFRHAHCPESYLAWIEASY